MPGFGSGGFGIGPFGQSDWSRRVLYDYLPEIYRTQDAQNGGLLKAWTEAVRIPFEGFRDRIQKFYELRDPRKAATGSSNQIRVRLGPQVTTKGVVEQAGVNATISAISEFSAPTGRFASVDIGKSLEISGSLYPENNRTVTVTNVIDNHTLLTDPVLKADSAMRWMLRASAPQPDDRILVEVWEGDALDLTPGWRLLDGKSEFEVVGRKLFALPLDNTTRHLTHREGADGFFAYDSTYNVVVFLSPTGNFNFDDVGRVLSIPTATEASNADQWVITRIANPTSAVFVTYPNHTGVQVERRDGSVSPALPESGLLYWAVLPRPVVELEGRQTPKGVVVKYGFDLEIVAQSGLGPPAEDPSLDLASVKIPSARLDGSEVGMWLVTHTYDETTSFRVRDVDTASGLVTLYVPWGGGFITVPGGAYRWELRASVPFPDEDSRVLLKGPSQIEHLAGDFGIAVNQKETEQRQRDWVVHVSDWIDNKSASESYRIIGELSGYTVTAESLYRLDITTSPAALVPEADRIEVADSNPGRSGADGSLTIYGGRIRLSSPTAAFTFLDKNLQVRVSGSADADNDKLYTIASFVDSTTVEFRFEDLTPAQTLPDGNNGAIAWSLVKLYTKRPPRVPRYDDFDADIMSTYAGLTPDKFCWESDFNMRLALYLTNVTAVGPSRYQIYAQDTVEITVGGFVGSIVVGNTLTGLTSGTTGTLRAINTPALGFTSYIISGQTGAFTPGETISNGAGGTAIVGPDVRTGTASIVVNPAPFNIREKFVSYNGTTYTYGSTTPAFYLATPVSLWGGAPPIYTFDIEAAVAPSLGLAILDYDCPLIDSLCGYCPSSALYLTVASGAPQISPDELKVRLQEVTPAHATPIYNFV